MGRRAPHRLAYELMGRIEAGALRPGDWLPAERELLEEFPASRTAFREALIILECLGLIESHLGVGSQVIARRPTSSMGPAASVDLVTLLEACRAFEIEAASLAAGLPEENGPSPFAPSPSLSPSGLMTARDCRDFHVALAQGSGNPAILASIRNLWDMAAGRPALYVPLNAALARSGRGIRALQSQVGEALLRRSSQAIRQAVKALFDGYLAAAVAFEDQDGHTRSRPRVRKAAHGGTSELPPLANSVQIDDGLLL
ncbi:FadR/GntR family transcriptional regulator [Caulobacter sp. LjRoot300]|uniref:FadR/GntR family transcriptional regulator n=1 Tax=Caulobacter sp. LjRoot300 TaxID=3342321 RepID=UPI003ECD4A68